MVAAMRIFYHEGIDPAVQFIPGLRLAGGSAPVLATHQLYFFHRSMGRLASVLNGSDTLRPVPADS